MKTGSPSCGSKKEFIGVVSALLKRNGIIVIPESEI